MEHKNYLEQVRLQYEQYPYPPFDPETEKQLFTFSRHDLLDVVNFHCFEGKCDFTKPFSVLIAGGGTGTSTITWAEQLRGTDNEIVYVDMSQASMDVCKRRAEIRGLTNIRWVHDSILEIPKLALGEFDFICCTGVLHHLASPEQGLAALKQVLKPDGAMLLMVYAKYGRSAIYQMQDLMGIINRSEENLQQQVDSCKAILDSLQKNSALRFNEESFSGDLASDNGIYDLFLHSQDKAYSVPELYGYIEQQGLQILDLFPQQQLTSALVYDPAQYIGQPDLLQKIRKMEEIDQRAICEILNGRITMHECFVAPQSRTKPSVSNMELIPSFSMVLGDIHHKQLQEALRDKQPNITLGQPGVGTPVTIQKTPHTHLLLKYVDGKRTVKQILRKVIDHPVVRKEQPKPGFQSLQLEFSYLFRYLNIKDIMFLREKSIPKYKTIQSMQVPVCNRYGTSPITSLTTD